MAFRREFVAPPRHAIQKTNRRAPERCFDISGYQQRTKAQNMLYGASNEVFHF